jgi:Mn2+/Fe2+ NRAMP family transporter
LITGASDDDPSGIATYSQTGAQFGYAMCWGDAVLLPAGGGDPGDQRAHRPG